MFAHRSPVQNHFFRAPESRSVFNPCPGAGLLRPKKVFFSPGRALQGVLLKTPKQKRRASPFYSFLDPWTKDLSWFCLLIRGDWRMQLLFPFGDALADERNCLSFSSSGVRSLSPARTYFSPHLRTVLVMTPVKLARSPIARHTVGLFFYFFDASGFSLTLYFCDPNVR